MINMNSKGFFFVVAIFLILSYILLSISIWTKAVEENERRFSDRFRTSNLDLVATQVTKDKLEKLARIVSYDALFKLNEFAADNPVKSNGISGSAGEFYYVNKTFYELMYYGKANASNFVTNLELDIGVQNSFTGWVDSLNNSISKTGMQIGRFSLDNFSIKQVAVHSLNYSFDVHLTIEEKSGLASISRDYSLRGNMTIEGLVDPAINREDKKHGSATPIEKQFFFYSGYQNSSNFTPRDLSVPTSDGQGWFYGPMVHVNNAQSIQDNQRSRYILVGNYTEIAGLSNATVDYGQFGAYIVTNTVEASASACPGKNNQFNTINALVYNSLDCPNPDFSGAYIQTNKPFIVRPNFNINSGGDCPDGKCMLFVMKYSYEDVNANKERKLASQSQAAIYDIEKLRDFTMCSYYVRNYRSPSYFQRLFDDAFARNSSTYGIETFLVGKYIGGAGIDAGAPVVPSYPDTVSRADRELFSNPSISGDKIRGMPGCRDFNMCSDDSLLGHFRLGSNAKSDFLNGKDISCVDTKARCE